ncbi:MAG TPA: hypothetical protein VG148_08630 [Pyrinomonadaceae bacterium]|nr:hypothetical protein [Pyrinomonadaceae bacterium]
MAVSRSLIVLFIIALLAPAGSAQKKSEGKEEAPRGTPVLWRAPSDIASRDLFLGPGGEAMKPDLSRITFVREETGGFSTKYRVKDGSGRTWVAKIGKEAQSETAAVRLVWAVGYMTEINYLVPRLTIEGKGTFENVRLEARPENVKRLDEWKWSENPFAGTKELQGLVVLMALLNNWDIKDSNNKVLYARDRGELHYVVSDLGATFGRVKSGAPVVWRIRRNRNDPEDYAGDPFLEDVKRGNVFLFYKGKRQDLFDDIRVGEARWIGQLLARLTDKQIGDAFRAANYTDAEVRLLTEAVRARISELVNLSPGGARGRKD